MNASDVLTATTTTAGIQAPAEPYPGPRPFRPGEEMLFHGRRRECADLVDLVLAYRAVVLYAQSAAGKTSLVNASVAPALRAAGVDVLPSGRVSGALPPGVSPDRVPNLFLFNLWASWHPAGTPMGDEEAARLAKGDLASLLPRRAAGDGAEPHPPTLVVIDQFEELFRACPERWPERAGFCRALGTALRADPTLRLLIAIREDYLAELDPYVDAFPDALRIRYRLERLHDAQALEAIVAPAARMDVTFEEGVAERLVRDLRGMQIRTRVGSQLQTRRVEGEFVEPVHLQVVCQDIWHKKGSSRRISSASVKADDVGSALGRFYERAVASAARRGGAREGEIRRWVAEKLITPAGTRGTVYQGDHETAGLANDVVAALESERIIRAEPRAGAVWYELTHDRFIEPIRASNRAYRQRRRKRRDRALLAVVAFAFVAWLAAAWVVAYRNRSLASEIAARDGDTLRALASEVAQQGDPDSLQRAIAGYTAAIDAYARTGQATAGARALLDRATVRRRTGRPDAALADYREAAKLYTPEPANSSALLADARAFARIGREFYQAGTMPEAIDAFRRASDLAAMAEAPGAVDRAIADIDLSLALARDHDYAGAQVSAGRVIQSARASSEVREAALARLDVAIAKAPLTTQAYDNLARLLSAEGDHLRAVWIADRAIRVAQRTDDPILTTLRTTRRDVLETGLPAIETTPGLREYVCLHNSSIVAASVDQAAAAAEARRFQRLFPLTRPGPPVGDQVPIVVDSFLTCDQAREVLDTIQSKFGSGPFVVRAYAGCPDCPGLPGRVYAK